MTKLLIIEGLTRGMWVVLTSAEAALEPGATWEDVVTDAIKFLTQENLQTATFTKETECIKFNVGAFDAFRARVEDL